MDQFPISHLRTEDHHSPKIPMTLDTVV